MVVIGILIALQVDNWNTEKENVKQERAILKGIKDDLVADSLHILSRFRPSDFSTWWMRVSTSGPTAIWGLSNTDSPR